MHPAYSIIVFSTLTGIGYGLAAVLGLGLLPARPSVALPGYLLALALIVGGLSSSAAHLGHPERAWRAFSQWRTSWLSREGVLAVVTFIPVGLAAVAAVFGIASTMIGALAAAFCAATVISTSMIYASLKTVAAWHTPLTPAVFLAFAAAGGLVAAAAIAAATGVGLPALYIAACGALVIAWSVKAAWWRRAAAARSPSTAATATGLGDIGGVRLLDRPHTNENYLTREMGYRVARKHAAKLRRIAVVLGAVAPFGFLLAAASVWATWLAPVLAVAALLSHMPGMLVERWLFFAEAKHTVTLYYGAQTA